jgi:hypothetical protein
MHQGTEGALIIAEILSKKFSREKLNLPNTSSMACLMAMFLLLLPLIHLDLVSGSRLAHWVLSITKIMLSNAGARIV